ncbi:MAG: protein-tyrosine phosphatase [Rickettsiales bacterium]|jgi:protein-tyrosine phosphatase
MKKILFICTGNICRSPTAHAVARQKIKELDLKNFMVDSAGISGFHSGQKPDSRSILTGEKKGVDFSEILSKKIKKEDFTNFDLIFAMDRSHVSALRQICPSEFENKIQLFLEYAGVQNSFNDEVIDPYYGEKGFDEVFELIEKAIDKIITND